MRKIENYEQYQAVATGALTRRLNIGEQIIKKVYERQWPPQCPKCGADVHDARSHVTLNIIHDVENCPGKALPLPTDPTHTWEELQALAASHGCTAGLDAVTGDITVVSADGRTSLTVNTLGEAWQAVSIHPAFAAPVVPPPLPDPLAELKEAYRIGIKVRYKLEATGKATKQVDAEHKWDLPPERYSLPPSAPIPLLERLAEWAKGGAK